MSGVSFPVTRPMGRALVVASPSSRPVLVEMLNRMGFECGECDDPYTATLELARRRLAYRALILSLAGLFREELALITTVKRRFPHLEIWLTHTDGRQATLAESIRLGADGLINDEGPHRLGTPAPQVEPVYRPVGSLLPPVPLQAEGPEPTGRSSEEQAASFNQAIGEPVLSAEELRALLQDQPAMPPSAEGEEQRT